MKKLMRLGTKDAKAAGITSIYHKVKKNVKYHGIMIKGIEIWIPQKTKLSVIKNKIREVMK